MLQDLFRQIVRFFSKPQMASLEKRSPEFSEETDVQTLILAAQSTEWFVALRAVELLGKRRDPLALDVLTKILEQETDEWVMATAAYSLGQIGDARAVPVLIATLQATKFRSILREVMQKARERTEHVGTGVLVAAQFASDVQEVRASAATALGMIRSNEAIPHLVDAYRDKDLTTPFWAIISALEEIGTQEAILALKGLQSRDN